MNKIESLDEIADDFCKMMNAQNIPVLMAYVKGNEEGMNHVRTRHSGSTVELISLVSSVTLVLVRNLKESFGIDEDLAKQLALDTIKDSIAAGITEEPNNANTK